MINGSESAFSVREGGDDNMGPGFASRDPNGWFRHSLDKLLARPDRGDPSESYTSDNLTSTPPAPSPREEQLMRAKPSAVTGRQDLKPPEFRSYAITARNVRGLQIGTRNLQVNSYEYQVDRPNIDFATVLSRAAVREALKALSQNPNNVNLQRKADKLLASGPLLRKQPDLCVERSEVGNEQRSSVIDAFVFVENSTGVQIGDRATQRNRFLYVVAPTMDAAQLLADDPNVRSAVIDCVCSPNEAATGDVFRDKLEASLEFAVLNSPDIRTTGDLIRPSRNGIVDVNGGDGVSIGKKGRQRNEVHAVVVVPKTVVKSVQTKRIVGQPSRGGLDRSHLPPDSEEIKHQPIRHAFPSDSNIQTDPNVDGPSQGVAP